MEIPILKLKIPTFKLEFKRQNFNVALIRFRSPSPFNEITEYIFPIGNYV